MPDLPYVLNKMHMIALIAGTNRPGSNTRRVTRLVEEIYAELKVPMKVLDLAQLLGLRCCAPGGSMGNVIV